MGSTPICISRMRSSVHYLIFNSLRSCLGLATSMSQESQLKRQGIAASGGVCRGRVHLLDKKHLHVPQHRVSKDQLEAELSRFESAIVQTRKELKAMHQSLKEKVGSQHADIFEAHLMVLEDAALLQETHQMVRDNGCNVEHAYWSISEKYARAFEAMEDDYLRERAVDLRDVSQRVLTQLMGQQDDMRLYQLKVPSIVVGHDLTPSMTAMLDRNMVLGFATDVGSQTSHTAILARALQIPAVVGLHNISQQLREDDFVLLDGYNGMVVQNPSDQILFEYGQFIRMHEDQEARLAKVRDLPAITLDDHPVALEANLDQPEDAAAILKQGADGVGLFRSEYLFLNQTQWPDEATQAQAYQSVVETLPRRPVTIRTLDLGADKLSHLVHSGEESNPALGFRAIRISLAREDIFQTQLRAILRASHHGQLRVMFPMVTSLEELEGSLRHLEACKAQLQAEGTPYDDDIQVGVMIETPAAAMIVDELAEKVDFVSIGTNDLIQYAMAVDRTNDLIAGLYQPTHPAIIRLISQVTQRAHAAGTQVGVCGEMAGEPVMVPLLIGLGVDELSVAPPLVPRVKYLIRRLKLEDARDFAAKALKMSTSAEILQATQGLVRRLVPEIMPMNTHDLSTL